MVLKQEELKEGWIDVKEKRPEKNVNVLCAYDYCGETVVKIGHYVRYDDYGEYISCEKWKYIE